MKHFMSTVAIATLLCASGCATSNRVVVNPGSELVIKTAYVVLHGSSSEDMDANVQRELMAHGIQVTAGPETTSPATDIIVRYSDNWRWDMIMYLRSLDIQVYSGGSGALLASGSWKNSVLHGFHDGGKVTKKVLDEVLAKL